MIHEHKKINTAKSCHILNENTNIYLYRNPKIYPDQIRLTYIIIYFVIIIVTGVIFILNFVITLDITSITLDITY